MTIRPAIMVACLLLVCACGSRAEPAGISIRAVETSLGEGNPKATLERYFNCDQFEGSAYDGIASGAPEWIALAERMLRHSDACYTEGILSSLGRAMQRAPRNVLPLVEKSPLLAASQVCLPFISDELPVESQLAEIEKSQRAIEAVSDAAVSAQKAICLRFIESVKAGVVSRR